MKALGKKFKHGYIRAKSYIGRPRTIVQVKPIIAAEIEPCLNPIFIIGVHRSGTSLLRRIINSHPNIACPPETYFLRHFAAMLRDQETFAGLAGFGYESRSDCLEQIRIWASKYHEAYRIANDKARWADKTPQYSGILDDLKTIFGDRAQFLMLFRHPYDVAYSLYGRGWEFAAGDGDRISGAADYVAETLSLQQRFLEANEQACLVVKYEDLVTGPEAELRRVFSFLGEDWDSRVLDYHKFDHNYGVEDPIVRGAVGFIPNFGNWKALEAEQLAIFQRILGDHVARLGYANERDWLPG